MAIQIVMDRTGDTRHYFNPDDAQDLAKAEQRFYELTKVGFAADRSIRMRKRLCSSPGWSAGSGPACHVRLSTVVARWPLPRESDASSLHQARRRGDAGGQVAAALAKVAVAGAARAVHQEGLL